MQRFYNTGFSILEKNFILKDKVFINQLVKVLRSKVGDKIILFNAKDNFDYIYEISSIEKKSILLSLQEKIKKDFKQKNFVNLFQALPNKLSKIELILKKGVEVGISNFYFFPAKRSQIFPISENKKERLKKIIIEASEQSGQNKIPEIFFLNNLNLEKNFLNKKNLNLFFHTNKKNSGSLKNIEFKNFENINIFIGPEGGFSEEEISFFKEKNFSLIYLGKNILRTETTGIVVSFFINQFLN